MRPFLVFVLTALVLAPAPVAAQTPPEEGIRAAVQAYVAAFNAGDADAAAAAYAPDGTHTYVFGVTHRGRIEIADGLRQLWAGPMKGARIAITTQRVRPLASNVAVEEEAFVLDGLSSPDGAPLPSIRGLCLAVHQREGDRWVAAAVQCLVPPPSPQATESSGHEVSR